MYDGTRYCFFVTRRFPAVQAEILSIAIVRAGLAYMHLHCRLPGKTRNQKPDTCHKKEKSVVRPERDVCIVNFQLITLRRVCPDFDTVLVLGRALKRQRLTDREGLDHLSLFDNPV